MKATFTCLFALLYVLAAWSQAPFSDRYELPGARHPMGGQPIDYTLLGPASNNTPPPAPVRLMAEWEEVQALLVSWDYSHSELLREIVRHGARECQVYIFAEQPDSVEALLAQGEVPMDNIEILSPPYNSIWIRDYGPWTIYHNDVDSLMIADWKYNRFFRPDDDKIPAYIAEHLGLPVYEAAEEPYRWVHTGGNNLQDGMGTIFASDLVLRENPDKTEAEIDELAQLFLGAERFIKFPELPYDGISHIDMHMRFIDEETVFFGEYPEGVADGPQIEANIEYLREEFLTPFGNTYNILRLPMPPDANGLYPDNGGDYRTYTNSLFINETVLVPTYEERYDTTALRIYREHLPGYNIVGIDCNGIIPQLGAIHCITKLVGANNPLWIAHPRLRDTEETEEDYDTYAIIKHRSGIAEAHLHYRSEGDSAYTAVPMVLEDSAAARWSAAIPAQSENTVVEYYISAQANSGKEQVRPLVAPEGYFRFKIDALRPGFSPEQQLLCPGDSITFENSTAGAYDSIRWHFPGGQPAFSNEESPAVSYAEAGQYPVELVAYRGSLADTLSREQAVEVKQLWAPYEENFAAALPEGVWEIENPQQDATAWERMDGDFCDPGAMRIEHFLNDSQGTKDFFRANFDLSSLNEPALRFDYAYALKTSNFADGLRVNVIDCSGDKVAIFERFGIDLATAPSQLSPFEPDSCDQWRSVELPLTDFAGEGITLEFESIGDYGNNLYLDLVNVLDLEPTSAPSSLSDVGLQARVFPNPARGRAFLGLVSSQSGELEWTLYNTLGQALHSEQASFFAGRQQLEVPLSGLPSGMYTLAVRCKGARAVFRLSVE
jgi:agmatine/peptidylarginine deiminase/PKD repeat protein